MKAGERRSDVESELASDDPTDLDDMVFSDEEESREVIATSAVHRDPTATSPGEEQEAAQRTEVPTSKKHAASADAIGERAGKWTRSPRPSAALPAPSSPVANAAGRAGRSEERPDDCAATGLVPMPNLRSEEAPPAVGVAE